jgi:predicted DsbA family dithiol-disulfide isomerase
MWLSPNLQARLKEISIRYKQRAEEAGLEMVIPTLISNTRLALEAYEYARERKRHGDFLRTVFRKYFGEGENISLWEVLRAAGEEVGLDPEEMQRETESGKYTVIVDNQVNEAYAMGVYSVPTYIINGQYAIVGAQPYEVFMQAMDHLRGESVESLHDGG